MSRHNYDFDDLPPLPPHSQPPANTAFQRIQPQRQYRDHDPQSYVAPVSPPSARQLDRGNYWPESSYSATNTDSMVSNITPGADNYSERAAGGIAGIAMGVADQNARESGVEAMRNTPGYDPRYENGGMDYENYGYDPRHEAGYAARHQQHYDPTRDYAPQNDYDRSYQDPYSRPGLPREGISQSSLTPLGAAGATPAMAHPHNQYTSTSPYSDTPYQRYTERLDPTSGNFDPNSIEDDGDDGLEYRGARGSMMSLAHHSDHSRTGIAGPAVGGAAAGGVLGALGGMVGRRASGVKTPGYGQVQNSTSGYDGGPNYDLKSEWLTKQKSSGKKWKWTIGIVAAVLILGGVGGGVAAYFLTRNNNNSSSTNIPSGSSAADDSKANGDLMSTSAEIKALMGNKNLRKVFPGVDYTPMYTQYPDCLHYPASQNNVTRDLAVLSQLTNVVRLYGTDCNQTEMVIHGINQLNLKGKMKVWLGVWQDGNATTNARQLEQMYKVLASVTKPSDYFLGAIVGNEVLFRQELTIDQLGTIVAGVKTNFTSLGYSLPVATADLGNKWTAALASKVDIVMANVHPFFTGKDVSDASSFTWQFWHDNNFVLKPDMSKNYIAETGWPTRGGTNCGTDPSTNLPMASCPGAGSVAGITELNRFMGDWVCQALANGTNYFWFEAFDEPWKIKFNSGTQNWEDQWGLMDVNRNLKSGVMIPDCGGKTVPAL